MAIVAEEHATLHKLAVEAMRANDNDVDLASAYVEERLKEDDELFKALAWPVIKKSTRDECRSIRRTLRTKMLSHAGGEMSPALKNGYLHGAIYQWEHLLDFPLPNGVKLRKANRGVLNVAMKDYYQQAETMMARRQWLISVYRSLPDDEKLVEDVFTEEQLKKLYNAAQAKIK